MTGDNLVMAIRDLIQNQAPWKVGIFVRIQFPRSTCTFELYSIYKSKRYQVNASDLDYFNRFWNVKFNVCNVENIRNPKFSFRFPWLFQFNRKYFKSANIVFTKIIPDFLSNMFVICTRITVSNVWIFANYFLIVFLIVNFYDSLEKHLYFQVSNLRKLNLLLVGELTL